MKGIVSIIEMVITVIVLFTAFNVIFPRNVYQTNWGVAQTLLNGRDALTTMDRMGVLYQYSYNRSALTDFAVKTVGNASIVWSDVNGLIKSRIVIDCNCTNATMSALNKWLLGATVNNRRIDYSICYTTLENINPCSAEAPDVLLIDNYSSAVDSSALVKDTLLKYLSGGNGIVEMADFPLNYPSAGGVQNSVFGVSSSSGAYASSNGVIRVPQSAGDTSYVPYKYFYHIPLTVTSLSNYTLLGFSSVPTEGAATPCTSGPIFNGTFGFYQNTYQYWICGGSVYFDTDSNGKADMNRSAGATFPINGSTFYMKYVNTTSFGISFRQSYAFRDFVLGSTSRVNQTDGDYSRVFLSVGTYSGSNTPVPAVIVNGTSYFRTAWVANFARSGFDSAGDDHRLLLISLLFWASNKRSPPGNLANVAVGYSTSYVSAVGGGPNDDMFEPYTISLGLGQPY